jgi:hypothetical protein
MSAKLELPRRAREALTTWYGAELLDDLMLLEGSLFGWLFGRSGQHAVTINQTVHLTSRAPELDSDAGIAMVGHECFHITQHRELGWWRFFWKYVLRWRPSHVKRGWEHPMEKPAYERGREIIAALTEG